MVMVPFPIQKVSKLSAFVPACWLCHLFVLLPLLAAYLVVVVPPQAPPDVVMVKSVNDEMESFISVQDETLCCQVGVPASS